MNAQPNQYDLVIIGGPMIDPETYLTTHPSDLPPHVRPKPGGGGSLSRYLLMKPGGKCNEILDGLLSHQRPLVAEGVEKVGSEPRPGVCF